MQAREAEAPDNYVTKVLRATVRDLREQTHGEDEPRLWVDQAFYDLVDFVACVGGESCSGDDDAVGGVLSLFLGQERGLFDAVWEEQEHGDAPDEGKNAENDVHPFPRSQGVGNVAYTECKERGNKAADTVTGEPNTGSGWDFVTSVP